MTGNNSDYLSPRKIREKMDVSAGTVRRWAKQYSWKKTALNSRVIRYLREDVEKTLGVTFS
jgi:transposase